MRWGIETDVIKKKDYSYAVPAALWLFLSLVIAAALVGTVIWALKFWFRFLLPI